MIIDGIAEKGIDGIYLASVPCHFDGVADFVPSALEEKPASWLPFWKMNLLLNWSLYTLCIRWGFVFIQMVLAECVYAAKFISVTKSKELVKTICRFASVHQAADLQKDVFLCDRVKSMQKGTLNIISRINMAMAKKLDGKPHTPQKISFKYLKYTINDVEHPTERRQGKLYKVSPYRLLLNDGRIHKLLAVILYDQL